MRSIFPKSVSIDIPNGHCTGIYNEITSKGPSATGVSRGQTQVGEERLTTVAAALLGKAVKLF